MQQFFQNLFPFGKELIGCFVRDNSNSQVVTVGVQYLKIVCVANFVQGLMHIYGGILRGTGELKGFLAVFCSNMVSRVVFSYILFPLIGEMGIWVSVAIGWVIGAGIGYVIYKKGKWAEKRLI